jgi:diadenosine tetraphosphatase ApaH/serine/threonine PP2A family protein phosphatase
VLGLLYDVHGNLRALDAVLADAGEAGVGRFLLGGDYAVFGPEPAETVARLRELDARWIRGNGERWVARPQEGPNHPATQAAFAWTREQLGDEVTQELGELPEQEVEGDTRFCHGSPVSDVRSFFPEPAPDEPELVAGVAERRLVFGHTHLAFARESVGGLELVNPGSVGQPWDGDTRAAWAILHDDGRVEHRRVAYDHEAAAAAARSLGMDWSEVTARRIEAATFEP